MITVTRFNQSQFIVNAELIEFIEALPDTHITLVTGRKLLVCESTEEVLNKVLEYRRSAGARLTRPLAPECDAAREGAD